MTIMEAINRTDGLIHNTYSEGEKVAWLSNLDSMVKRLIIDPHEGSGDVFYTDYNDETSRDLVLLVPAPFDEIYLRWLEAKIHYYNGEFEKYNSAIVMYNTAFDAYANFYKRNHMPLSRGNRFVF